jgi:multidrug efflux pump subunit AcrA (membrane-fusion protein)
MNLKKWRFVIFTSLILFAIFLTIFWKARSPNERVRIKQGNLVESIYGLGTVTPDQIFHVRSGLTAWLRKLFVKEGDSVETDSALVQLDDRIVRSPITGTVTQVDFKQGEIIPPQVSIVNVTNLKKLYLEVSLEQQSILRIRPQQKAYVSFESLRGERYDGQVLAVFPKANQFIVRIELENWPKGILPGMTADVAILVGEKQNVLLIPLQAISAGRVTRIRNGKREKIPVQLGMIDGEWAEVTSQNISVDDEILVNRK